MRFLVTGTGHSGTGWAARLFTALGHACGHEEQYRPGRLGPLCAPDSSWLAVPHLGGLPEGTPVVHLVRHPLAVIASFLRSGTYRHADTACVYTRHTYRMLPGLHAAGDELGRCIVRTCEWDRPVAAYTPHLVVRIEDCAPTAPHAAETVQEMVAFATGRTPPTDEVLRVLGELGTRGNAHAPGAAAALTWGRVLAHPLGEQVAQRCREYGYTVEGK